MKRDERRQFERLQLSEDAFAVDEKDGAQLGRVTEAGGGGFLIFPATPEAIKKLTVGNRLRQRQVKALPGPVAVHRGQEDLAGAVIGQAAGPFDRVELGRLPPAMGEDAPLARS